MYIFVQGGPSAMKEYKVPVLWKEKEDKIPLYFRLYECKKQRDCLIVYLHGAVGNGKFPYYNGMGIASELKSYASFLLVSDPLNSLYSGRLRCSWYASPYPEEEIIKTIAKSVKEAMQSVGASRVLFLGGSAAGIPLMRLGEHIDNAFFFIWNPQTNIFNYNKGHIDRWCNALQIDKNFRGILEGAAAPTSVDMNFKSHFKNRSNHYFVLQMLEDYKHVEDHMTPFYEALSGKKANFTLNFSENALPNVLIHIGAWASVKTNVQGNITGHIPPSRDLQTSFIKDFIASSDPRKDFTGKYFRGWDIHEK
jgi:hypothetical protein